MKICLIGQNLTNLILATDLIQKKLKVDIYIDNNLKNTKTNRTIAISSNNFEYLNILVKKKIPSWPIQEIKIYLENSKSKEIINFTNNNKESFNLLSYNKLLEIFSNKLKNSKYIQIIKSQNSKLLTNNFLKKYDLVINSENKNAISTKYFNNKIKKNYKSLAYTFMISHKKISNNIAKQIFTKHGPLAFLPFSNTQTSIVFSYTGHTKSRDEILKSFNKYNAFYDVKKISGFEKFGLSFVMQRNYVHKNILAFGDLIHRIHPLAGQGFNMTLRDIKNLSIIIDKKINLGLPIDISVANEFQKSTKHLNFLYGKAIDGIYEFFKFDNQLDYSISKPIFNILNKNSTFKKFSNLFSEKGLSI